MKQSSEKAMQFDPNEFATPRRGLRDVGNILSVLSTTCNQHDYIHTHARTLTSRSVMFNNFILTH